MSRRIISGIVFALAIIIVMALRAPQMQVRAAEPPLEAILDGLGFTNRTMTTDETFPAGTYKVSLFAEYASYCDQNTLSWYVDTEEPSLNLIFSGPEGVPPGTPGMVSPPLTKSFTVDEQFGLSLCSPDGTWFTQQWRNIDENKHARVYKDLNDPEMLFIGFENSYSGGDADCNDMVIALSAGGVPTPIGTDVTVFPTLGICFIFEQVTTAGCTTATALTPPTPPLGLKLIGSYYEIGSTAGYTDKVTIRMSYEETGMTPCRKSRLMLLRYDALATDVSKDSKVDVRDVCKIGRAHV